MKEVIVGPISVERLAAILPDERAARLAAAVERARTAFGDRVVWHVNATAHGGGVAEMLQTLLAYGNAAGVENRWMVLDGDAGFFAITKRLHNILHGEPGDGGNLGVAERAHYEEVLRSNLAVLVDLVSPGDIVLAHDPQTAALTAGLREHGAHVVWRCHIGRDRPNDLTQVGWDFLRPYLTRAEALVFSRREYAPEWVDEDRLVVIPPSIDPFAVKNMPLPPEVVIATLAQVGIVADGPRSGPVDFVRRDGGAGTVRTHRGSGGLVHGGDPPPADVPLVVQVSRWDRLKDMAGVMEGFVRAVAASDLGGAHLVLAGPDVSGVSDDPEGAEVLAECLDQWQRLPPTVRGRVHLASIPMDDADENAIIVNALQRRADVVVQKSIAEGFGLTVAEAMWKGRPVVASAVGGIQDQIEDGTTGYLVDPEDLAAFGERVSMLLADPYRAERIGHAAQLRVRDLFLGARHLGQYVDLFARVL